MSEDEKIRDYLIGTCYTEDTLDMHGDANAELEGEFERYAVLSATTEFYKDGRFDAKAECTLNYNVEELGTISIVMELTTKGTWKLRDKYLYYSYEDFDVSIKSSDVEDSAFKELSDSLRPLMRRELIDKNSPDEIVEYSPARIVYKDADGDFHLMKKTY
jgi:hypothetical protein